MQNDKKILNLDKKHIFNIFFISVLAILLYHLWKIFSPFITPLFLAVGFAIIFHPVNYFFKSKGLSINISALLTSLIALFVVIIPMLLFAWLLFKEAREIYPKTIDYLNKNESLNLTIKFPDILPLSELDLKEIALKNIEEMQEQIIKSGTKVIKNIFFVIIDFIIMIITLFVLSRDGDKIVKWILEITPMDIDYKHKILKQFYITIVAVVRGIILTAIAQGVMGAIGYYIGGVPSPVLFGALTSLSAIIPFIGTTTVWLPLSIAMYFLQSHISGIFIFLWGLLVVGLIDNILRPILIGQSAKLPVFLLFLGIFGGLKVYGPIGLFMGPILISMVITFLQIYKEHFSKIKNTEI